MFEKEYTFRYSDLDKNIQVKISTVLDILQDISILHSAKKGYTLKKLYARNIAWLLQGWRIRFIEPLDGEKPVLAKTGVMRLHRYEAVRKYELWQDGVCKVIATGSWFTVNTERMKVILVPEDIQALYETTQETDNELPFIKLRPEKELPVISETKVEKRDLDSNNHMNNVKSAEVAFELLPENFGVSELQITYRKALMPASGIFMCGESMENGYAAELKNDAGESCVLMYAEKCKNL